MKNLRKQVKSSISLHYLSKSLRNFHLRPVWPKILRNGDIESILKKKNLIFSYLGLPWFPYKTQILIFYYYFKSNLFCWFQNFLQSVYIFQVLFEILLKACIHFCCDFWGLFGQLKSKSSLDRPKSSKKL